MLTVCPFAGCFVLHLAAETPLGELVLPRLLLRSSHLVRLGLALIAQQARLKRPLHLSSKHAFFLQRKIQEQVKVNQFLRIQCHIERNNGLFGWDCL